MRSKHIDFLGVVAPSAAMIAEPMDTDPALWKAIVPGAAGAVAGSFLWPKHRVLGFLGGESVGLTAYRFIRNLPGDRTTALTNLAVTGAAVATSLKWKAHPFWGFILGMFGGAVATSFVTGSNANRLRERLEGE